MKAAMVAAVLLVAGCSSSHAGTSASRSTATAPTTAARLAPADGSSTTVDAPFVSRGTGNTAPTPTSQTLGEATDSGIEGLPVPAVATESGSPTSGVNLVKSWLLPSPVTLAQLKRWYFGQLGYQQPWQDWKWCDPGIDDAWLWVKPSDGQSLAVTIIGDGKNPDGPASVLISTGPDDTSDC